MLAIEKSSASWCSMKITFDILGCRSKELAKSFPIKLSIRSPKSREREELAQETISKPQKPSFSQGHEVHKTGLQRFFPCSGSRIPWISAPLLKVCIPILLLYFSRDNFIPDFGLLNCRLRWVSSTGFNTICSTIGDRKVSAQNRESFHVFRGTPLIADGKRRLNRSQRFETSESTSSPLDALYIGASWHVNR